MPWGWLGGRQGGLPELQLTSPLQTVRELLENPTQAVSDMSYFNCLDSVMENSKVSGERGVGLSQALRVS